MSGRRARHNDNGFNSGAVVAQIAEAGAVAVIPSKTSRPESLHAEYVYDVVGRLRGIGPLGSATAPFWARYHYSPGGLITAAEASTPRLAGLAAAWGRRWRRPTRRPPGGPTDRSAKRWTPSDRQPSLRVRSLRCTSAPLP